MTNADRPPDPTRVRNQPELRSPRSVMWLVPAGILGAIAVALLALNMPVDPVLARLGILLEGALFVLMIVVALVRPPRRRLGVWFAALMIAMAVVALVILGILATTAWTAGPGS